MFFFNVGLPDVLTPIVSQNAGFFTYFWQKRRVQNAGLFQYVVKQFEVKTNATLTTNKIISLWK